MPEQIKITIVLENDKSNNAMDGPGEKNIVLTHDSASTLMSTLLQNRLMDGSFCGGKGDCGRCRVRFLRGATIPTPLERSVMEAEELRRGYRLACLAKPKNDCVIELAFSDAPEIEIVSDMIDMTENIDHNSQKKSQTKKQRSIVTESRDIKKLSFGNAAETGKNNERNLERGTGAETVVAVDLGTTTIAMQLVEIHTGQILDTWCGLNPQRCYGADVVSRIQASCAGSGGELRRLAEEALEQGVAQFREQGTAIRCMCIAGNTTMEHLLLGYDVSPLGRSPFTPVESGLQMYRHTGWEFPVYVLPVISAFVGGDIVAGLYACGLLPERRPDSVSQRQEKAADAEQSGRCAAGSAQPVRLLIDLGTNGEMAITDGTRTIAAATAAGPAFEGGAGTGIAGSDMIACTAALLREGIADGSGLLAEPYFAEGVSLRRGASGAYEVAAGAAGASADLLRVTQADIRAIQMAKAAVRAGVEILWRRLGAPERLQVYLAGGFGYYLDVEAAFRIGLLPEIMRGSVRAAGNTSLGGAYLLGRDLASGRIDGDALEGMLARVESLNLAAQKEFEALYIRYMDLGSS